MKFSEEIFQLESLTDFRSTDCILIVTNPGAGIESNFLSGPDR